MHKQWLIPLLAIVLVTSTLTGGVAAQTAGPVDECQNAERGPGENGPPGFVAGLVPNFISELIGSLPVPNFVKTFFGASTC